MLYDVKIVTLSQWAFPQVDRYSDYIKYLLADYFFRKDTMKLENASNRLWNSAQKR